MVAVESTSGVITLMSVQSCKDVENVLMLTEGKKGWAIGEGQHMQHTILELGFSILSI